MSLWILLAIVAVVVTITAFLWWPDDDEAVTPDELDASVRGILK